VRGILAATALTTILLSTAACGTETDPPAAGATTGPAPQPLSIEEFCGDYGEEVLKPLSEDFAAATGTFTEELPDLDPQADQQEIGALVDGVDEATQPLVEALQDAADRLEDQDVASDVTHAAETLSTFPDALRDAVTTGDFGDEDPAVAIDEAFGALDTHCE
jgi:hypothetical protein